MTSYAFTAHSLSQIQITLSLSQFSSIYGGARKKRKKGRRRDLLNRARETWRVLDPGRLTTLQNQLRGLREGSCSLSVAPAQGFRGHLIWCQEVRLPRSSPNAPRFSSNALRFGSGTLTPGGHVSLWPANQPEPTWLAVLVGLGLNAAAMRRPRLRPRWARDDSGRLAMRWARVARLDADDDRCLICGAPVGTACLHASPDDETEEQDR